MRISVSKIVKWRWERDGILTGTRGTLSEELTKVPKSYYYHPTGPQVDTVCILDQV